MENTLLFRAKTFVNTCKFHCTTFQIQTAKRTLCSQDKPPSTNLLTISSNFYKKHSKVRLLLAFFFVTEFFQMSEKFQIFYLNSCLPFILYLIIFADFKISMSSPDVRNIPRLCLRNIFFWFVFLARYFGVNITQRFVRRASRRIERYSLELLVVSFHL